MNPPTNKPAGGGIKKVLYTLKTAQSAGLRSTAKALNSKNACKTCGLGMGGQLGGMANEMGEYPSVCNKSVQAQSTDLQPPIPPEIFEHNLQELQELDERELAHLGRLGFPLHKSAEDNRYQPISWSSAIELAAARFRAAEPDRTFFYSSGRSSNEAGFVLQLFARMYGTNNVNNCSYYCHQATSEGLHTTIGTGTSTVELADLQGCDFIMLLGANPASNHPRFIHQLAGCRARDGEVVVVNPAREPGLVRFALPKSARSLISGGTAIASEYLQPRIGADIALLKGIAKAVIEAGGADESFLQQHADNTEAYLADVQGTPWEEIIANTGIAEADIRRVAHKYCAATHAVFAWGMGLTHHTHGVNNVEEVANLAMLRGMVGKRYAGLLPLRGHSNVQGIGTIGVKPVLEDEVLQAIEERLQITLPQTPGMDTMACLDAAERGDVDAALIMGGNLYSATPNSAWADRALGRIPFRLFLTTTLNRSHVYGMTDREALVLPVAARDEEAQPTTQESMFNYVRLSDGGIVRHAEVRSETAIVVDLAKQVLGTREFDFDQFGNHTSVREAIAATVPGLEALASIDVAKQEFHVSGRLLHTPKFATPNGRCRLVVNPIPKPQTERPFTLASVRSEGQFNTLVYENEDSYRGVNTRWCVLMNASDMKVLGLANKELIDVVSDVGRMDKVAAIPFDVPRGNMLAYFPEANVLTDTATDPISKTPAFKSIGVSVEVAANPDPQ